MSHKKDIDFNVLKEDWNIYKLEDGTILKIKIILMRVIEGDKDPHGNPLGGLAVNTLVAPIPPNNLRDLKNVDKKIDLKFETIKEEWNEYSVADNTILKIKPMLSQIDRTDKIDPRGEPFYGVIMQPTIKRIPMEIK